jgi:hypothetical protein
VHVNITLRHLLPSIDIDSMFVSIATRHVLEGQATESRWGRDFSLPSEQALEHKQPPVQWVPGLFPEGKRLRLDDPPPTSSAEVKEV